MAIIYFTDHTFITTAELVDALEREDQLGILSMHNDKTGLRCVQGVIEDRIGLSSSRWLTRESFLLLYDAGISPTHNDAFIGTPTERCAVMVRRMKILNGGLTFREVEAEWR